MRGVSEQTWLRVYRTDALASQGGCCRYCREPLTANTATADHVKPRAAGGPTNRENVKAACRACNMAKGDMKASAFWRAIKRPQPGSSLRIWRAYMRRRIWLRTHRACGRIRKAVA